MLAQALILVTRSVNLGTCQCGAAKAILKFCFQHGEKC